MRIEIIKIPKGVVYEGPKGLDKELLMEYILL